MAHFAELDSNNIVIRTIVVSDRNTTDTDGIEKEEVGVAYCKSVFGQDTLWKQCSRSYKIRKQFPAAGYIYNEEYDFFHHPKPYDSWTLNTDGDWEAPYEVPYLTDDQRRSGFIYNWNENRHDLEGNGWELYEPQVISITEQPWPYSVNVSVGSSITISAEAVGTKEGIASRLEKKSTNDAGEVKWDLVNVPFFGNDESSTTSLSSTLNTGICTDTSHSGEYRMVFYPRTADRIGEEIGTASVTVTVTE